VIFKKMAKGIIEAAEKRSTSSETVAPSS